MNYTKSPNGISNKKDLDDKVIIISSEYFEDTRPSYICGICNQTLIRLTDSSMQNSAFWCRDCSVEFDPENENVRRESKLSVPDRNIEPAVATTPGINYKNVSISHEPEIKGGLKPYNKRDSELKTIKKALDKWE